MFKEVQNVCTTRTMAAYTDSAASSGSRSEG